jgi:hypothetical protein
MNNNNNNNEIYNADNNKTIASTSTSTQKFPLFKENSTTTTTATPTATATSFKSTQSQIITNAPRYMEEYCPDQDNDDTPDYDLLTHVFNHRYQKYGETLGFDHKDQNNKNNNINKNNSNNSSTNKNYYDSNDTDNEKTIANIFDYNCNDEDVLDQNDDDDVNNNTDINTTKIFSEGETYPGSTLLYQENGGPSRVQIGTIQNEFNLMIDEMKAVKLTDGGKIKIPSIWMGAIDRLSVKDLIREFHHVYELWCGEEARNIHPITLPYAIFGIDMKEFVIEEVIDKVKAKLLGQLTAFDTALHKIGLLSKNSSSIPKSSQLEKEMESVRKKLNKLYEVVYHSHQQLVASVRIRNIVDEQNENATPIKYDLFNFHSLNFGEMSGRDKVTLFVHRRCAEKKLRKKGKMLYKLRYIKKRRHGKNGGNIMYATHKYEEYKSIERFALDECNPHTNSEMWQYLREGNNQAKVVEWLEKSQDDQLPDLKEDRTVSAWTNGLFFAEYNAFLPYGHVDIPPEVCASVFINQKFDNRDYGDNYMKIPCVIKQILADQDYDEFEQSFILAQLGRLLFKPGKYDRWEVIPFLWGTAGTGKSCIIEACMRYFDRADVAGVGNSIEKQFGLAPLIGKNLWVAMDVKHNFGMDAGDLQTITSLEAMSVAVKYQDAITLEWDVPGIIAGNELPRAWKDTLQSLARRIMLIPFPNPITRDNSVKERLKNEHSAFYKLTVSAYHHWSRQYGDKDIWKYAPKKFVDSQKVIQRNENPLEEFLEHGNVEFTKNEEHSVPISLVNTWFRNWCANWGHRNTLVQEELVKAMARRGIKCRMESKMWMPSMSQMSNEPGSSNTFSIDNGYGVNNKNCKTLYQEKQEQYQARKEQQQQAKTTKENKDNNNISSSSSSSTLSSSQQEIFNNSEESQLTRKNERFFIGILLNSKSSARNPPNKNVNGLYGDASKRQNNYSQHINLKK